MIIAILILMTRQSLHKAHITLKAARVGSGLYAFARRHRLVLPLFLLVMAAVLSPWQYLAYANNGTVGPSQVIMQEAVTLDQGVHISWLESQPGTFSVARYIIERRSNDDTFTQIGTVSNTSLNFIDPYGKNNDAYQVIAEDNQKPAHRSLKSESMASAAMQPGANTTMTPQPTLKNVAAAQTIPVKIAGLQDMSTQAVKMIGEAIAAKDDTRLAANLTSLQDYQRQILSLLPSLSPEQKASVTQIITEQSGLIVAKFNSLPEKLRMDGLLVQAGYEAIRDAAK
jgi:hypothetical protein